MSEGLFERMTIGMVIIVIGVFGLIMYANPLFIKQGVNSTTVNNFDFINKVNELNNTLDIMYTNTSQSQDFLTVIGLGSVLSAGWKMVALIPNIVHLFMFLPYELTTMIIPYNGTGTNVAAWLGGLLNVIYLGLITFAVLNVALNRREGST